MNKGDLAIEKGDMELAMKEYSAAEEMFPENLEMKYWHAVTLASNGKVEESLPMFREVFNKNEDWRTLTPRLVPIGMLTVSEEDLKKIISVK
jgi:tetratricopeptide (TPR) repeat protein